MFLGEDALATDKGEVPGQSNAVDKDPIPQKCHEGSHDEGREKVHVQPVSRIPEFST